MAVGVSSTTCNDMLNTIRGGAAGVTYTAETNVYMQIHTANPGAAGTTAISSVTTRVITNYGAASGGVISQVASPNANPSWASWAGTNGEIVTHISVWDAISGGTFLWSAALTLAKTVNTGDTITVTASSLTFTTAS